MSKEFTIEWLTGYMAKWRAESGTSLSEDVPDTGLESTLQKKVMDHCKENGWPCFHDRSKKVNEPGWADCFIFLPMGKVLLVELKSSTGTFRKDQKRLRLELNWNGHKVHPARSFKRVVEIIQAELKKLKKRDKGRFGT